MTATPQWSRIVHLPLCYSNLVVIVAILRKVQSKVGDDVIARCHKIIDISTFRGRPATPISSGGVKELSHTRLYGTA